MPGPAIGPIVSHNVRGFFQSRGISVRSGMGLDETLEALFTALTERKEDDAFWAPLEKLMADVFECARRAKQGTHGAGPASDCVDVLKDASVVKKLRESLPDEAPGKASGLRKFVSTLSKPVAVGFLMMAVAASSGCWKSNTSGDFDTGSETDNADSETQVSGDSSGDTDSGVNRDTETNTERDTVRDTDTWIENCSLDRESILYLTLESDDLDWARDKEATRATLCACFTSLNQSWSDGLTELFRTASDEEISAALLEMFECCSYSPYLLDEEFGDAADSFLKGYLCSVPLPYKGVSFPSDGR